MANIICTEALKNLNNLASNSVLYFYGEETFLIEETIKRLVHLVAGKENDFSVSKFYGDEAKPEDIMDAAQTLPMGLFGQSPACPPRRLVLVRRADSFKAKALEAFLPYLQAPSPDTCLVFWGGEKIDSRRKFFKSLGKMDKKGLLVHSEPLKGKDVCKWLQGLAKRRGHSLEKAAADLIEMLVGNSLYALDQAVEKLSLFLGEGREITRKDVRNLLADTHEGILWSITHALSEGDEKAAFLALKRILRQKEISSPVLLLATLGNFYRRLFYIRLAKELHIQDQELMKASRLSPGALYHNRKVADRFSCQKLQHALHVLSLADRRLKSSGISGDLILYDLVMELTQTGQKNYS